MKEVIMYECEHCKKKVLRTKSGMRKHEKQCFWNPETKSCMTCANYISGGHNVPHCFYKHKNKSELYSNNEYHQEIIKLQTNCYLHAFDELTLEERKELVREADSDAQSDWDDYHANIM